MRKCEGCCMKLKAVSLANAHWTMGLGRLILIILCLWLLVAKLDSFLTPETSVLFNIQCVLLMLIL